MLLLIDNYDSFTYNLLDYFMQLNTFCKVVRNDACTIADINRWQPKAIVISPGPKTPALAGISMSIIKQYYQSIPILGICLGHQAIGEFFGAKLETAKKPMHGLTSIIEHNEHPMFYNLPKKLSVMRYHSLLLNPASLAKTPLNIIAQTTKGEIMAIAHKNLPILGCQFHPESILTPQGLQILDNCLRYMKVK